MSAANAAIAWSKMSLVDLSEDDLPELASFVATQTGCALDVMLSRLTWLLLENPARQEFRPLGCGVRSSHGALVGCILYLPQMFVFEHKTVLMLGSTCFYVDEAHRGSGGALFLKFTRAANQGPLFGNSANAIAAQLWEARGATPIADSDHELLGIIRWPPVVEELAVRRGADRTLARAFARTTAWLRYLRKLSLSPDTDGDLVRLSSSEELTGLLDMQSSSFLTAHRDESYIRWRYFSQQDPSVAAFAFRDRRNQNRLFVATNERPRGYRMQIRSLNVLDVFPKPEPDMLAAIVAALHQKYRDRTDMIVLRNLDAACGRRMLEAGFKRRNFELPNGWLLDRRGLLPTRACYFVPADGDWLI